MDNNFEDPRIEALRNRLSGTRQTSKAAIDNNVSHARIFLTWLNKDSMERQDVDRYFAYRRENGISENSLRTEFGHLKNLFEANGATWPFDKYDVPKVDKKQVHQPTLKPEEINQLIIANEQYSPAERLYLAISTTWAPRRESMSKLNTCSERFPKRYWNEQENTLIIPGAKGNETVKHIIPDVLIPLFKAYRLQEHKTRALSYMFHRIIDTAALKLDMSEDWGWHSIRRGVDTVVLHALKGDDKLLWAYSTGWSKEKIGKAFYGSAMAGFYDHPEILDNDPFWIDQKIYEVHPFLKTWKEALYPKNITNNITEKIQSEANIPENQPVDQNISVEESALDRLIRELKKANGG